MNLVGLATGKLEDSTVSDAGVVGGAETRAGWVESRRPKKKMDQHQNYGNIRYSFLKFSKNTETSLHFKLQIGFTGSSGLYLSTSLASLQRRGTILG